MLKKYKDHKSSGEMWSYCVITSVPSTLCSNAALPPHPPRPRLLTIWSCGGALPVLLASRRGG
eukprot:1830255-Prorocentrum_lima.AAC.1